jgi:phosphoglycolate phosphatase
MTCDTHNSSSKNSAAVFDLDGTLMDTSEDIAFNINYLRKQKGLLPLSTTEVLKFVGRGIEILIRGALEIDAAAEDEQNRLIKEYQACYREHRGIRSAPYPGIPDAVRRTAQKTDLYVLSNKTVDAVKSELEIAGLIDCFTAVWGAGSFEHLKPNPVGIHTAARLSEAALESVVMTGDLDVDLETAARAKVPSIFVAWGFGKATALRHRPARTVHSPDELPRAIFELLKI